MAEELKRATVSHSPGPWRKCGGCTPSYTAIAAGRKLIIGAFSEQFDMDTQQANARLIAAAPELLAAVEIALSDLELNIANGLHRSSHVLAYRNQLKALVAKATGKPLFEEEAPSGSH